MGKDCLPVLRHLGIRLDDFGRAFSTRFDVGELHIEGRLDQMLVHLADGPFLFAWLLQQTVHVKCFEFLDVQIGYLLHAVHDFGWIHLVVSSSFILCHKHTKTLLTTVCQ